MSLGQKGAGRSNPNTPAASLGFLASNQYDTQIAKEKNWLNLNALSHTANQGACGSCWAVATTRLLAAHSEISQGANARTFSTQELIDCVPNKFECGGAFASLTSMFIIFFMFGP